MKVLLPDFDYVQGSVVGRRDGQLAVDYEHPERGKQTARRKLSKVLLLSVPMRTSIGMPTALKYFLRCAESLCELYKLPSKYSPAMLTVKASGLLRNINKHTTPDARRSIPKSLDERITLISRWWQAHLKDQAEGDGVPTFKGFPIFEQTIIPGVDSEEELDAWEDAKEEKELKKTPW